MARGNCLIAFWWWWRSGRKGDLVMRANLKDKRGVHFVWAPYGICEGTRIKHRQPRDRKDGWRAWFHWWFTYVDRVECVRDCDARAQREKAAKGKPP